MQYLNKLPATSIEQVLTGNGIALAVMKKEISEAGAVAVLVKLINATISFFSVGKGMNDDQVIETAKLLLQEFYYLKLDDLKLFFDRLKTGFYGATYDRIDGQVLMLHLRAYCAERMETAERMSDQKHAEIKALEAEQDWYHVKVGDNYVSKVNNEYREESRKDAATKFNLKEAKVLKQWLVAEYYADAPDTVKIDYANKPEIGLYEYVKENKPEWLTDKDRHREMRQKYYADCERIDLDMNLSDFEKSNAKRELAGLKPWEHEQEYRDYLIAIGEVKQETF